MTCIVGYIDKQNKNVIIGADSASTSNRFLEVRKDPKVFKNYKFVIGCTTSFRMIQLLRFSLKLPEIDINKDIYEYMCTDFITAVRECFRDNGYLQKETEGEDRGGMFLVGYKNRLFKVEPDFQVGEVFTDYDSIGCGYEFALGALHIMDTISEIPVTGKVKYALEAATFFSPFVCEPYNLLTTWDYGKD